MPSPAVRLAANQPGPLFVNSRCIDCGTCWQFDPLHFAAAGNTACVQQQPEGHAEWDQAHLAMQACPVAAIQADAGHRQSGQSDGFPVLITRHAAGDVYYCGWTSRTSYGASSWLVAGCPTHLSREIHVTASSGV